MRSRSQSCAIAAPVRGGGAVAGVTWNQKVWADAAPGTASTASGRTRERSVFIVLSLRAFGGEPVTPRARIRGSQRPDPAREGARRDEARRVAAGLAREALQEERRTGEPRLLRHDERRRRVRAGHGRWQQDLGARVQRAT